MFNGHQPGWFVGTPVQKDSPLIDEPELDATAEEPSEVDEVLAEVSETHYCDPLIAAGEAIDPTEVPDSYDRFVALYFNRIMNHVRGFSGIHPDDVKDITQWVVMQFIAGDYLNIYSKDKQQEHARRRYEEQLAKFEAGELPFKPKQNRGLFSSFVFEFVHRRLMGARDRFNRKQRVEGSSIDVFFEPTMDNGEEDCALVAIVGKIDDEFQSIELRQILQRAHQVLIDRTVPTATRNLPRLFSTMVKAAFTEPDGFDKEKYAMEHGITPSAVSMQIKDMRDLLWGVGLKKDLTALLKTRTKAHQQDFAKSGAFTSA